MPMKWLRMFVAATVVCGGASGAFAAGESLEPGLKALKAGKHEVAIKAFTELLGSKATAGPDLAKAYYYRGMAYSKSGKPAQSIADLTNALWLKGGLTSEERQSALTTRAASYEQTGFTARAQADLVEAAKIAGSGAALPEQPAQQASEAAAASTQTQPAQKAAKTATSSWQTEAATEGAAQLSALPGNTATQTPGQSSGGIGGFFTGLFSGGSGESQNATEATASLPPASSSSNRRDSAAEAVSVRSGARTRDNGTPRQVAAAPAATVAPEPQAPAEAVSSWGEPTIAANGSAKSKPEATELASNAAADDPAAGWQTSIADVAPAAQQPKQAAPGGGTGGGIGGFFQSIFGGGGTGKEPAAVETASVGQPASTGSSQAEPLPWSGSVSAASSAAFRLQIASVRSPAEASAIASDLQSKQTALLAQHSVVPEVSQQVLGSMGTFYQVTLGPFADERTSLKACNSLRRGGYDCFLIEN